MMGLWIYELGKMYVGTFNKEEQLPGKDVLEICSTN